MGDANPMALAAAHVDPDARMGSNRMSQKRKDGSPGRTRTCDKSVNSRLLYQLSYRGTPADESTDSR